MEELETGAEEIENPEVPQEGEEEQGSAEGEAPKEEQKPEESEELYALPDGKQVDAATLAKEWRDNFLPEFTRRSQELAALKNPKVEKEEAVAPDPWKSTEWEPKTYQELLDAAKTEAERTVWQKITEEANRETQEQQAREAFITQEIEQIKQLDPKVNINTVMAHASKYAFSSLIPAYQNLRAIQEAEKRVEDRVMKNIKLRAGEPVGEDSAAPSSAPSDFAPGKGFEMAMKQIRNK